MWYIALCGCFIIIIVTIIIISSKELKKTKKSKEKVQEDFEIFIVKYIIESSAIIKIIDSMNLNLEKIKSKELSKQDYANTVEQDINDLTVLVAADKLESTPMQNNLKKELEKLIEDIKKSSAGNVEIVLKYNCNESEYIYENIKLISAIKQLLLSSIENDQKNTIEIIVNTKENINSNSNIEIIVDNIKLINKKEQIEKMNLFFDIKQNIPIAMSVDINPRFYIARQNLSNVANDIYIKENNSIVINLTCKMVRQKKKRYKVLIVDDNKPTAELNQKVLKSLKIDSDMVFSGEDCLKMISNNYDKYDMIITDNQMPKMNGTELIKELKQFKGFDIPVIIVTGDNNTDNIFTEYYGFDGYVQKPLTKEKISDIIKLLLK